MKIFLIRLVLLFPLCIAAWWVLGPWQIEAVSTVSKCLFRSIPSLSQVLIEPQHDGVFFSIQDLKGIQVTRTMDPLAVTRGLPIYVALMLAIPGLKAQSKKALRGAIFITVLALAGFLFEEFLRVSEDLLKAGSSILIDSEKGFLRRVISAGFVQILTKVLATRVLPVALFLWQEREFLRGTIGARTKEGHDSL